MNSAWNQGVDYPLISTKYFPYTNIFVFAALYGLFYKHYENCPLGFYVQTISLAKHIKKEIVAIEEVVRFNPVLKT